MTFIDTAVAVLTGNLITVAFVAGFWQMHKHDYKAPNWAYVAVLLPIFAISATIYLHGVPDQSATRIVRPVSAETAPDQDGWFTLSNGVRIRETTAQPQAKFAATSSQ